jgi:dipeptidyl aminopeptidase/acylaminoacyl peptidase
MSFSTPFPTRSLRKILITTLPLIGILIQTGNAAAQDRRRIQANDLYRIQTASSIALSPDGSQVAYLVTQIDSVDNTYYRHIWLADVAGGEPRQLTRGKVRDGAPAWSPDGTRIAFVSGRGADGPQIYILPLNGGEAWQVTDLENGAFGPVWSPNGDKILFGSTLTNEELAEEASEADATEESEAVDAAMFGSMATIRNWLSKNAEQGEPAVITRLNFQGERGLDPIESWAHIYELDLDTEETKRLTDGPHDFYAQSYSPDGRRILFAAEISEDVHPDYVQKSDLYVMDADGSNRRLIGVAGYVSFNPQWSPDGSRIAFAARDTLEPSATSTHVGVIEIDASGVAGEVTWVSRSLDRSINQYHWASDGESIYFSAGVHGTIPIYRAPVGDGEVRQVVSGERGVQSFDLAGETLAYSISEPANPSEIYVANADGVNERRVTDLNTGWLSGVYVQPHAGFWYRSFDGKRVQGWVIEPVGYEPGSQYPLAVEMHGGPHVMWGPGEASMWHEFQLLAANGYVVLYTNPRGSGGYGYDFKLQIQRAWGEGPMRDVLTAADSIVARGFIDEDRMVVTGGSYAGYLTAYLVGNDHRFAAAVAQRGVYDLAVFFGEGNAWQLVRWEFDAYPWEDPDILRQESPMTYAHLIETPLLIIHSDRDLRTGVSQSEMLYRTLKVLERPVEYARYPREGHDLSRSGEPLLRIDRLLRILEFFDRYAAEH